MEPILFDDNANEIPIIITPNYCWYDGIIEQDFEVDRCLFEEMMKYTRLDKGKGKIMEPILFEKNDTSDFIAKKAEINYEKITEGYFYMPYVPLHKEQIENKPIKEGYSFRKFYHEEIYENAMKANGDVDDLMYFRSRLFTPLNILEEIKKNSSESTI